MAGVGRWELDIRRDIAAELGRSAVIAVDNGFYFNPVGEKVDWRHLVDAARARKQSIAPQEPLPKSERAAFSARDYRSATKPRSAHRGVWWKVGIERSR
jgi:hypothetical protein